MQLTSQNNTGMIGFGSTPSMIRRAVASRGMAGLGDMFDTSAMSQPGAGFDWTDPKTMTAINSEIAWLVNLSRTASGQAPLPPQLAAPSVNVGLTPEAKNTLLLAGAGILALFLLSGRAR